MIKSSQKTNSVKGSLDRHLTTSTPEEYTPSWRCNYEVLAGYIVGGHQHGLYWTEGADGAPVSRPMCLNIEHYYAKVERGGRFVPRLKAEVQTDRTDDDTVVVRIAPFENWDVSVSLSYTLLPDRIVEARFEFVFGASYRDFEAFISNYFHAPTEPYIHLGGVWIRPQLGEREHRYWARSDRDAQVIKDGRLDEFLDGMKEHYDAPVDPNRYDLPIMVTPIGDSGWSVVNIIEQQMCPSLSVNRNWKAHDFSLIGHDVEKGQRIVCRAWMIYAKLENLNDVIPLYEQITGESGRPRYQTPVG
jgi:hypothetical protein